MGLISAFLAQRLIAPAMEPMDSIPLGFAVTDEQNACAETVTFLNTFAGIHCALYFYLKRTILKRTLFEFSPGFVYDEFKGLFIPTWED
jgi:hypothetical protein